MCVQEYAGEYDLAEDEEIESFYFSSAAGRARVLLGNRRHGEGGFISGGRRQARPAPEQRAGKYGGSKAGGSGSKSGKTAAVRGATGGMPPVPPAAAGSFNTPNAGGGRKARPGSAISGGGSTPGVCMCASVGSRWCLQQAGLAVLVLEGGAANPLEHSTRCPTPANLAATLPGPLLSSAAVPMAGGSMAGADLFASSPSGSAGGSALYGSSPSGSGRRARRNARRAAMDAGIDSAAGSWGRD